ncbi:MAG: IclR family transcriptional regulator [Gammaproteobacteria bacterium]|nr:MAG: IclR family transcriptional regulator [Gammaproteobacteria bacterium]
MTAQAPIEAVVTSLRIVESLAEADGPLGVSEIASLIGSTKPRVFRHLRTLLERHYVIQDPATDKYLLTLRLFHLAQSIPEKTGFLREARRILPALRDEVRQSVAVGVIEEHGVRVVEILRHLSAIQITTTPGTLFGFAESAQGKIALAFGPATLRNSVLRAHGRTAGRSAAAALKKELEEIRVLGWAVAPEAVLVGVNAVAVPVVDAHGELVGTIALVGSVQYLSRRPDADLIKVLQGAAQQISHRLGFNGVTVQT